MAKTVQLNDDLHFTITEMQLAFRRKGMTKKLTEIVEDMIKIGIDQTWDDKNKDVRITLVPERDVKKEK